MRINILRILMLTTLIITLSSCIGAADDIHANSTNSIQAAVNSANSGDVIIVEPGTYSENILISNLKTDLVIRSESGDPADTIITAKDSNVSVITIQDSSYVTIKGLKITGAGTDKAGVYLLRSTNCIIENNVLHNDALGVFLKASPNNVVRNNIASKDLHIGEGRGFNIEQSDYTNISGNTVSNQKFGIYLIESNKNNISGNIISKSTNDSITVVNSISNVIVNNTAKSNARYGIYLSDSSDNSLRGNPVSNGINGIYLVKSPGNKISDNNVDFGIQHDIMLDNSSDNILTNNTISSSPYGIAVRYSNNNNLTGNNAYNNSQGLYITLTSSNNKLSGNKANSNSGTGISLYRVSDNILESNEANSNTNDGIVVDNSSNNEVFNNSVSQNNRGIYLSSSSSGNTLSGNKANSNSGNGIVLDNVGSNNNITSNTASSNVNYGIYFTNSNNTYLLNNIASGNSKGIYIITSNENVVSNNTVSDNNAEGIMLSSSNNNKLSRNTAYNDSYGISFSSSRSNEVSSNKVTFSRNYGLFLCSQSTGNQIFNNYLNNTFNTDNKNTGGIWNTTKAPGASIVGGSYIGGNYWATPLGTGFSQLNANNDPDGDGIINSKYDGDNLVDYYPLVAVSAPEPAFPVADFTANPTSGSAPLLVSFTDRSQNATSRSWNFGDGATSTDTNPTHSYSLAGNYTVNLTVSNLKGTNSKTAVITVLENEIDVPPVADFIANPTSGSAPLSVSFTDRSQNATSRSWNFGDGATSTDTNPTHSYSLAGNYTVNLTVSNLKGTNSKTAVITVSEEEEEQNDGLPVANFETNVTSGYAPLSVLFTDRSQDATSRSWDFGDGVTSTELNPTHTYSLVGTYPAKLTVSNANGTTSKTILIAVERKSSGGSSSGGGGGGSPEFSRNIEAKELSQVFITNGKAVKFDFTKAATCVVYVSFDSKKTAGKITTIAEMLKGKSSLVSELPSGEVYKSFNLWVGNGGFATSNNIENPVVCFKVEKAWLQDKKIDRSSIVLNRYSDKKWVQLPVSLLKEDDKYLYFTAETPGFSSFAITGKANTSPEETVTEIQPGDESDNSEENTEDTGSEADQAPEQKEPGMPGFEMVYGVAGLLAVFLYKRK